MLSVLCVLTLAAGACGAAAPGGQVVRDTSGRAVSATPHRDAGSPAIQLVVESSGDLLIHSPVWERALVLGGGRHYNFAPLFARVGPYIRSADLPLCHLETPLTPGPPASYPVFNTPPELARGHPSDRLASLLDGVEPHP